MNPLTPVRQIMTPQPDTVNLHDHLSAVRHLLRERPFHHVPVLDDEDHLVGMLSSVDIARFALDPYVDDEATVDAHLDTFTVGKVMTPEPEVLSADDTVQRATDQLADGIFHALPVVDHHGRLLGIVTTTDLLRFYAGR